jgi:hypothetical protein
MHTLLALSILLCATPDATIGLSRNSERAARLMNAQERAQLASLDGKLQELRSSGQNSALRVSSIIVLAAAVAVPVVCGVGALFFGGLVALLSPSAAGAFMVAMFSWIPVWGWAAMAVAATVGTAMLVGSIVADQPRQHQIAAAKEERRALIKAAKETQLSAPVEVPLATVMVF